VQHTLVKKTETMSKDLHGILQFIFQKKFGQSKLCISVFEKKGGNQIVPYSKEIWQKHN